MNNRRTLGALLGTIVSLLSPLPTSLQATMQQAVPAPAGATKALAFRNVTVIDVRTGRHLVAQTVVVVGTRVQTVGPTGKVRLPQGAKVIDARGKYLIPGLWDMELYLDGAPDPLMWQLIANGITGYRNLGQTGGGMVGRTTIDSMLTWRREIAAGTRIGPRLLIGGPMINGNTLPTPAQARLLVDSLKTAGADHIFIYTMYPDDRDLTFAILAEARRLHIPVVGHLPDSLPLAEVSDSGMHAVDHADGTEGICVASSMQHGRPKDSSKATLARCTALAAHLRRNNTWVVFGPLYPKAPRRLTVQELSRRQQYTPKKFREFSADVTEDQIAKDLAERKQEREQGGAGAFTIADQAGLSMLLATDLGALPLHAVGFQLHDDLAVIVEQGIRPLTALQMVTLNPAKYWNATDSLGTVETGKLADLVLLDADPLADIYNTQRIRAVVANGRYFDRPALDSLLVQAGAYVVH